MANRVSKTLAGLALTAAIAATAAPAAAAPSGLSLQPAEPVATTGSGGIPPVTGSVAVDLALTPFLWIISQSCLPNPQGVLCPLLREIPTGSAESLSAAVR